MDNSTVINQKKHFYDLIWHVIDIKFGKTVTEPNKFGIDIGAIVLSGISNDQFFRNN